MAFSPNSAQSREMAELRNHLKWLDEERRKTARKMGEMEQRIAQQGRDITEREKRIHELEWQLAQLAERLEQMPELGTGSSAQEQRLQDLEWHMSNINAQLVRLPKLDEELANFREELSQYSVDIENRLVSQQADAAQRLESDVYSRLREDIAQSVVTYNERLDVIDAGVNERLAMVDAGISERLAETQATVDEQARTLRASFEDELDRTIALALQGQQEDSLARIRTLEEMIAANGQRLEAFEASVQANDQRFAEFETNLQSNDYRLVEEELRSTLDRLEQELELRQAEEIRLANLMGVQESKVERTSDQIEEMNRVVARMQSQAVAAEETLVELRGWYKDLNDNWKPALMEASGKLTPLSERLTALSNMVTKAEANIQTLAADQSEMRDGMVGVSDELRQARQDLTHQIDTWQGTIDEHKETVERFTQQWLTLSNQYKEARMAVQNFAHWQKQLEQQKREASEMLRVESNRMQSRWEGFLLEIQEQLKNADLDLAQKWQAFEMENEQRWAAARRSEQLWREELAAVDDLIVKLQQDSRNLIWRVQAAQADAIKKWPRLLLEEVEKAVELNPNRRLQSTTPGAVRTDMSVVDAIEQGLIKVDYDDELSDSAE